MMKRLMRSGHEAHLGLGIVWLNFFWNMNVKNNKYFGGAQALHTYTNHANLKYMYMYVYIHVHVHTVSTKIIFVSAWTGQDDLQSV